MRILVIEDTPANMRLVAGILQREGHIVLKAETAELGIEMVQQEIVDLILMDIQLPKMDGLTATRILKQMNDVCHIPIIALTANAMKDDEEKILKAGCDGYISKPIRYKLFLKLIKKYNPNNKL